jgi:cysteinyl-tRNA synthetase
MLRFYNTKSRKYEAFAPISNGAVTIYTCGPTVYDYLHVGNWSSYIRWDTLVRTLTLSGYKVNRVMNITDVGHLVSDEDEGQDKLVKSAEKHQTDAWSLAKLYTDDFMQGLSTLSLVTPQHITKATDFIPQQLEFIRLLKNKGVTYQIDDGIYFDTSKFPKYADFAKLDLVHLREGARIASNPQKRNPSDFALWKFSPSNEKRDMEWDTPSDLMDGETKKGFPGWHLECSAMILDKLGETIDIHTGGIDHIPVHHTNEIAQSTTLTGRPLANYWLHSNFLHVNGTKISKSLGNSILLSDISKKGISTQAFKLFVLQSHYRTETNFTWDNLTAAQNRLNNWFSILDMKWQLNNVSDYIEPSIETELRNALESLQQDLDTPQAIIHVEKALNFIETSGLSSTSSSLGAVVDFIDKAFGLKYDGQDLTGAEKNLISERSKAREEKDWEKSDSLRDKISEKKISLMDNGNSQIWSRIR